MPKKVNKEGAMMDDEKLALLGLGFWEKKRNIKELETQCKEARKPLEEAVEASGHTTDRGSKILVIPFADKEVHIKETLRVGKVLLPEAMDVLRANGLEECIEDVPTIREDILERLYENGDVSDEVLKKIYAEKNTYAFSVDVKDRFDV